MRRVSMLVAGEETRRGGWKEVDEDDRGKWRALACAGVVVVDELVVVVVVGGATGGRAWVLSRRRRGLIAHRAPFFLCAGVACVDSGFGPSAWVRVPV